MHCLVIADEADTARYICNGLKEAGHTTTLVRDGVNGLHLATKRAVGHHHSRSHAAGRCGWIGDYCRQLLNSRDNRQEVVAGELTDFAGDADAAIGEQDLGLADAAGVKEELARRRIARGILVAEAEVEIAERDPARLAAPSHMDQALPVRQHAREFVAGARSGGALKARRKGERAGGDSNIRHDRVYRPISAERRRYCRRRRS
jgi:hypothetical protein